MLIIGLEMFKHTTYIWQLGIGTGVFRFQTTDPRIARKLNRTNAWKSVQSYCNKPIWIFQKSFATPQDARKKLQSLCKVSKIEKGSTNGEYYAITYANKTLKN